MNEELLKAINASLDPEQLKSSILAEAQKQLAANEAANATHKAEQEAAAARLAEAQRAAAAEPTQFSHTENIAGKDFIFTGASQAEIDSQVAAAYRVAFAIQQPTEQAEPTVDPAVAAAAAEAEAAAKIALQEQFRNGTISAEEYLEKSGAINNYLERQGLSVETLKATVEHSQLDPWVHATDQFLQGAGADWPGGDKNREILGLRIQALGLVDAEDKVAAMSQAWNDMKRDKMYFPAGHPLAAAAAPEVVTDSAAAPVVPPAAVPAPVVPTAPPAPPAPPARAAASSSSLFDRSTGVADFVAQPDKAKPAEFVVPDSATPQQIMDAYKKFQVANGLDPNSAFMQQYRGK
jgi:hypothetical protein